MQNETETEFVGMINTGSSVGYAIYNGTSHINTQG